MCLCHTEWLCAFIFFNFYFTFYKINLFLRYWGSGRAILTIWWAQCKSFSFGPPYSFTLFIMSAQYITIYYIIKTIISIQGQLFRQIFGNIDVLCLDWRSSLFILFFIQSYPRVQWHLLSAMTFLRGIWCPDIFYSHFSSTFPTYSSPSTQTPHPSATLHAAVPTAAP